MYIVDSWNTQVDDRLWNAPKHPTWVKEKQSNCCKTRYDVVRSEGFLPCGAEKRNRMLLAHCIDASALESLHLLLIDCFNGGKHGDVAGLELVGSM